MTAKEHAYEASRLAAHASQGARVESAGAAHHNVQGAAVLAQAHALAALALVQTGGDYERPELEEPDG